MKKYLTLMGVFCLTLLFSQISAKVISEKKATLKVLQPVSEQMMASTEKAIKRFKKKYPNVKIETQYAPLGADWREYITSFINELATPNPPDIVMVAIEGFAETSSKGVLLDLEKVYGKDSDAKKMLDGIEPNLLDGMRTRPTGVLHFFPTEWNNVVTFYNKDMFDEAGVKYPSSDWDWDDFLKAAKALTKKDKKGNITQYGYFVPGYYFGLQPWFLVNNASVLDKNWRIPQVKAKEFRQTIKYLHDLINVHQVAPTFTKGVGTEKFVAGQVAMFSAGHWPVKEIVASGMKNVGVQHMPKNKRKTTVYGIGGLGIIKYTKNPDIAWDFIKEMTGEEFQQELADFQASIPTARKQATSKKWMKFPDNSEIFYETAKTAIAVPSPPNFSQVNEIFIRHLDSYFTKNQDLNTTIRQMDREISRSMSRAYK